MLIKRIRLVAWLLISTVTWSLAQSDSCVAVLRGRIAAQDNLDPLVGATVYVRELGTGAVADEHGFYAVNHICPGK